MLTNNGTRISFLFELYVINVTCKALGEKLFTLLLVGTLGIIFFAIFFREPPRIVKVRFKI